MTLNKTVLMFVCLISTSIASNNYQTMKTNILPVNDNKILNNYNISLSFNNIQHNVNNRLNYSNQLQLYNTAIQNNCITLNINNLPSDTNQKYISSNVNGALYMQNNDNNLLSQQKAIVNKILQNINYDNDHIIKSPELEKQIHYLLSKCDTITQLDSDNFKLLFEAHKQIGNNNIVLTINNNTILLKDYYNQQMNILLNQLLTISLANIFNMREILRETQNKTQLIFHNTSKQICSSITKIKKEISKDFITNLLYKPIMKDIYIKINEVKNHSDFMGINLLKVITIFSSFISNWCEQLIQVFDVVERNNESVAFFMMLDVHLNTILKKLGLSS